MAKRRVSLKNEVKAAADASKVVYESTHEGTTITEYHSEIKTQDGTTFRCNFTVNSNLETIENRVKELERRANRVSRNTIAPSHRAEHLQDQMARLHQYRCYLPELLELNRQCLKLKGEWAQRIVQVFETGMMKKPDFIRRYTAKLFGEKKVYYDTISGVNLSLTTAVKLVDSCPVAWFR